MTPPPVARRSAWLRAALLPAVLLLVACGPSRMELRRAVVLAEQRAPTALDCARPDACAIESPLRALATQAFAASSTERPRHYVRLLEGGQDALLARIHLIRSARRSIELQSFIYSEDDSGYLVLDELLQAARRGVRVRVLLDQLYGIEDLQLLAQLAQAHANFSMRLYNPTFNEASTSPVQFAAGVLCCFFRFNQRMHNKLLLVDGQLGVTGGRNYQDRYFDWDPGFNYRDRDVLVAGPAAQAMEQSFDGFWAHALSVPLAGLRDVAPLVLEPQQPAPGLPLPRFDQPARIAELSAQASDHGLVQQRLAADALQVGRVEYISDRAAKPSGPEAAIGHDTGEYLRALVAGAQHEVVLQTPYLVLSRSARRLFEDLQQRQWPPDVIVSSNSLASTDAFPVYALSHKYKRTYLRELGFTIYEYKPFPANAPIDLAATGAWPGAGPGVAPPLRPRDGAGEARTGFRLFGSARRRDSGPVPLEQAGVRISMHAKSLVIDARVAVIGTHNFDPRSDHHNTESVVVVHDAEFARRLRAQILADTTPGNSWVIAPRPKPPVLSGLNYSFGKLFEQLPLFDFWPWRYATSWEYVGGDGCAPMPPEAERFAACYQQVGDFPGVRLELKAIYTRILTAFGAGLAPIL